MNPTRQNSLEMRIITAPVQEDLSSVRRVSLSPGSVSWGPQSKNSWAMKQNSVLFGPLNVNIRVGFFFALETDFSLGQVVLIRRGEIHSNQGSRRKGSLFTGALSKKSGSRCFSKLQPSLCLNEIQTQLSSYFLELGTSTIELFIIFTNFHCSFQYLLVKPCLVQR